MRVPVQVLVDVATLNATQPTPSPTPTLIRVNVSPEEAMISPGIMSVSPGSISICGGCRDVLEAIDEEMMKDEMTSQSNVS